MVNVGKREDNMLDYINAMKGRIDMAQVQIELYKEVGLTANELEMLNMIASHLAPESDE